VRNVGLSQPVFYQRSISTRLQHVCRHRLLQAEDPRSWSRYDPGGHPCDGPWEPWEGGAGDILRNVPQPCPGLMRCQSACPSHWARRPHRCDFPLSRAEAKATADKQSGRGKECAGEDKAPAVSTAHGRPSAPAGPTWEPRAGACACSGHPHQPPLARGRASARRIPATRAGAIGRDAHFFMGASAHRGPRARARALSRAPLPPGPRLRASPAGRLPASEGQQRARGWPWPVPAPDALGVPRAGDRLATGHPAPLCHCHATPLSLRYYPRDMPSTPGGTPRQPGPLPPPRAPVPSGPQTACAPPAHGVACSLYREGGSPEAGRAVPQGQEVDR